MEYRNLGYSGLKVSVLAYGPEFLNLVLLSKFFLFSWFILKILRNIVTSPDENNCVEYDKVLSLVKKCLDLGINYFDTVNYLVSNKY